MPIPNRTIRRSLAHILPLSAAAAALQLAIPGIAQARPLAGEFGGGARAVSLSLMTGALNLGVKNGSHASCPCRGTYGMTHTDTAAAVSVGTILSADAATSTAFGDKTVSTAKTLQTETVAKLNLLGGLITADSLKASAAITASSDAITPSYAGTAIAHLVVAGRAIPADTPNNTTVALPGIGSVTIRAVDEYGGKNQMHLSVDMLVVDVTKSNSLGLPVGTKLTVAKASASYSRTVPVADLAGSASVAHVTGDAGDLADEQAGAGASSGIPGCSGTDGTTVSKAVGSISIAGVLTTGAGRTTAFGGPIGSATVAKTTASISDVSLLGGLITATGINAVAQESRTGTVDTPSTTGSGFSSLKVAGVTLPLDTPANTSVALPALGSVIVNEVAMDRTTVTVNGLHVTVTNGLNLLGLPVGTQIILAHASAHASKP